MTNVVVLNTDRQDMIDRLERFVAAVKKGDMKAIALCGVTVINDEVGVSVSYNSPDYAFTLLGGLRYLDKLVLEDLTRNAAP